MLYYNIYRIFRTSSYPFVHHRTPSVYYGGTMGYDNDDKFHNRISYPIMLEWTLDS